MLHVASHLANVVATFGGQPGLGTAVQCCAVSGHRLHPTDVAVVQRLQRSALDSDVGQRSFARSICAVLGGVGQWLLLTHSMAGWSHALAGFGTMSNEMTFLAPLETRNTKMHIARTHTCACHVVRS
jgi:hypothetical protein